MFHFCYYFYHVSYYIFDDYIEKIIFQTTSAFKKRSVIQKCETTLSI